MISLEQKRIEKAAQGRSNVRIIDEDELEQELQALENPQPAAIAAGGSAGGWLDWARAGVLPAPVYTGASTFQAPVASINRPNNAVMLVVGSIFALLLVGKLFLIGADATLVGLNGWGLPTYEAFKFNPFGDFIFWVKPWLFIPIGLAIFEIIFMPSTSLNPIHFLKGIVIGLKTDPLGTLFWLTILGLDIHWTFGGVKPWLIGKDIGLFGLNIRFTDGNAWVIALLFSFVIALCCEPLARKFARSLKQGWLSFWVAVAPVRGTTNV